MMNIDYWLWLSLKKGYDSCKITNLLEIFSSPEEIYNTSKESLKKMGIFSNKDIRALSDKSLKSVENVKNQCRKYGIRILTYDSPNYPEKLKHIPEPPYVLYVRSSEKINLNDKLCIGMVGTREDTEYGRSAAGEIASGLSKAGVVVVSGMARGIDGASHAGALTAGGLTVAVLGCGAESAYPPEHKNLMSEIIENGMVITEYPPGSPPAKQHFPVRNRIISGLSDGVVVVEAPEKSGSLITADYALKQGRDVFAVPGDIHKNRSVGTNNLIRDGAVLVTSALDVLKEYELLYINTLKQSINNQKEEYKEEKESVILPDPEKYKDLDGAALKIVKALSIKPISLENLHLKTGLTPDELSTELMMLELNGYIKALPGKNFVLNV